MNLHNACFRCPRPRRGGRSATSTLPGLQVDSQDSTSAEMGSFSTLRCETHNDSDPWVWVWHRRDPRSSSWSSATASGHSCRDVGFVSWWRRWCFHGVWRFHDPRKPTFDFDSQLNLWAVFTTSFTAQRIQFGRPSSRLHFQLSGNVLRRPGSIHWRREPVAGMVDFLRVLCRTEASCTGKTRYLFQLGVQLAAAANNLGMFGVSLASPQPDAPAVPPQSDILVKIIGQMNNLIQGVATAAGRVMSLVTVRLLFSPVWPRGEAVLLCLFFPTLPIQG